VQNSAQGDLVYKFFDTYGIIFPGYQHSMLKESQIRSIDVRIVESLSTSSVVMSFRKAIIKFVPYQPNKLAHCKFDIPQSSSSSSTRAGVRRSFLLFGLLCLELLMLLAESSGANSLISSSPGSHSLSLVISLPSPQYVLS